MTNDEFHSQRRREEKENPGILLETEAKAPHPWKVAGPEGEAVFAWHTPDSGSKPAQGLS